MGEMQGLLQFLNGKGDVESCRKMIKKMYSYEMSCLITKDLAREGQRVLVYFFRHCNSATKRIMSRVQNHHAKNECAHCPGFSRKFFEIPPFSCRKKVIKSLIWQV